MELNKIYNGDSLEVLKTFPSESIDCIITSPPYYGLRDYGIEGQIGQEKTPQEYISNLMKIMDECKRVLKKTGSCWINIGDSYGGTGSKGNYKDPKYKEGRNGQVVSVSSKLSPKSLLAIPERFVIAMYDSNWIRRNTITWYKPNCMPSSTKDRFTVDFEYFYFFTKNSKQILWKHRKTGQWVDKQPKQEFDENGFLIWQGYSYYFETQYEPMSEVTKQRDKYKFNGVFKGQFTGSPNEKRYQNTGRPIETPSFYNEKGRFKRCVWKITTKPFKEAHFAVFPEGLIETPIKACCPSNGIVLDPFMGSGTVGVVAKKLGVNYIGIELKEEYIKMAEKRINSIL